VSVYAYFFVLFSLSGVESVELKIGLEFTLHTDTKKLGDEKQVAVRFANFPSVRAPCFFVCLSFFLGDGMCVCG